MKKFLLIVLLSCCAFLFSNDTQAQDYDLAVGARFGNGLGFSAKKTLNDRAKLEGILYLGGFNSFGVTGLYEITKNISDIDELTWYYGGGLTAFTGYDAGLALGLDGIIGIEWNFSNIPLNVSADFKPTIFGVGTEATKVFPGIGTSTAITVRYIIR